MYQRKKGSNAQRISSAPLRVATLGTHGFHSYCSLYEWHPPDLSSVQPEQLYVKLPLMLAEGASLCQAQNHLINQSLIPGAGKSVTKETLSYIIGGGKMGKVFENSSVCQKLNTTYALSKIFF